MEFEPPEHLSMLNSFRARVRSCCPVQGVVLSCVICAALYRPGQNLLVCSSFAVLCLTLLARFDRVEGGRQHAQSASGKRVIAVGLDNYWELPESVAPPAFEPELNLCGGIFSGHGEESFRGKVYDIIVFEVTRVSLGQDMIPNDTVREMADKLDRTAYADIPEDARDCGYFVTEEEYLDLRRMFRAYADAGASLVAWR